MLPPPSLRVPLALSSTIQILSLPTAPFPNPLSKLNASSLPLKLFSKPSFPLSAFPTAFPYSLSSHHSPQEHDDEEEVEEEDEHVVGDCLVFDESAFEDAAKPFLPSNSDTEAQHPKHRKPAAKQDAAEPENLIPDKWKEAVAERSLTKKEKRKIAHQLKFGSRMERRRKPPPVPGPEVYRAYRDMKLSQLKPVVLDDPKRFPPEKEVPLPEPEGRLAPRNPRAGLGERSLEDFTEFFNSGEYVPQEVNDDVKPKGSRKLLTKEEKVLLNKRIPNLAEATSSKWLPLHTLAASGEFYLLDMLMKHNVDINVVNKDGLAAIHKAILGKKQAIVNYLLRNSANPFVRDKDGATLIHYAVQTASSQTIKILLLYNVDINLADDDGWTPLHLAVQTKRTDIVRLLLIKGADRTLKNQDGLTPLDLCLYSGHSMRTYELIKLLKGPPTSKSHH